MKTTPLMNLPVAQMAKPRYRWYYGLELWVLSNLCETDTELFLLEPSKPEGKQ